MPDMIMANISKNLLKFAYSRLISTTSTSLRYTASRHKTTLSGNRVLSQHVNLSPACVFHRFTHSEAAKGDKELVDYLSEEIKLERSNMPEQLPSLPGFDVKSNGSELVFLKKFGEEDIKISLSVNNSVQADYEDVAEDSDSPPTMVCKPQFDVEVTKGSETMQFNCAFVQSNDGLPPDEGEPDDVQSTPDDLFSIDGVSVYQSGAEVDSTNYYMDSEVMDGEMYERLMDYLADRGLDPEFSKLMIEYCTGYETQQYVQTLEKVKQFIAK